MNDERHEPNSTPPGGRVYVTPTALPRLSSMSDRALLEECARRSHHAWETAASAHEWVKELAIKIDQIAKRLGIVERAPREGSSPALERFADLAFEDLSTEVKRKALVLADEERARALAHENRKRAWSLAWKIAAALVAIGLAYAAGRFGG